MKIHTTPDGSIQVVLHLPASAMSSSAPAEYFSQNNCELLGLTKRQYLELLRRPGAPPALRRGKLRMVARAAMLEFLERLRVEEEEVVEEDGPDTVLRELGWTGRGARRAG